MKMHFIAIWVGGLVSSMCACTSEAATANQDAAVQQKDTVSFEPCSGITAEMLHGHVDPASDTAFARIPSEYSTKSNLFLRIEALAALESMAQAAEAAGISLKVISATRSWEHQRSIWNRKWNSPKYMGFEPFERAQRILEYSSMPGSSRHHWGTDVDLNSLENAYFESGAGALEYAWLAEHAADYGFVQVYGDQTNGRSGYREEKWHWSYWPLSSTFLRCYLTETENQRFSGFDGAEFSDSLGIVKRYVAGIDSLN